MNDVVDPPKSTRILMLEDDPLFGDALLCLLQESGYEAARVDSLARARAHLANERIDLVLLDMSLPDGRGTDLVPDVRSHSAHTVVLCLSAHLDVETIVSAMRCGVDDYLVKSDSPSQLIERVNMYADRATGARTEDGKQGDQPQVFWRSPAMSQVDKLVRLASQTSSTVLLSGETGTGKSFTARLIHRFSDRADKPFVTVDCAALSESLAESELFGHERGAFTGAVNRRIGAAESAAGGTLFFDEIADLPKSIQGKLLRILDERVIRRVGGTHDLPIDARIIAATRRDLMTMVEQGRLREDLFFRLTVLEIVLPPLRRRKEDIPDLARHLIRPYAGQDASSVLPPEAVELLAAHEYPGNLRELRNVVERLALLHASGAERSIAETVTLALGQRRQRLEDHPSTSEPQSSDDIGQAHLAAGGRVGDAASSLGMSRHALRRRLKKLQEHN